MGIPIGGGSEYPWPFGVLLADDAGEPLQRQRLALRVDLVPAAPGQQ
jgi:hypothetical protein